MLDDFEGRMEFRDLATKALSVLNERQLYIVTQRTMQGAKLAEIAVEFGLSKDRIRQIEAAALRKMYGHLYRMHGIRRHENLFEWQRQVWRDPEWRRELRREFRDDPQPVKARWHRPVVMLPFEDERMRLEMIRRQAMVERLQYREAEAMLLQVD